jgi:hypothetical protein
MNVTSDIRAVIDNYSDRGLLRNVRTTLTDGRATRFEFTWHYDRTFDLRVDYEASRMAFVAAFPNVSPTSAICREVTEFIEGMMAESVPVHRRIDCCRTVVSGAHYGEDMAVVASVVDGDFDYAARKLIQVMNELYFDFLPNSSHYAYQVKSLGLDPDMITFA